jgi:hypothetical protein
MPIFVGLITLLAVPTLAGFAGAALLIIAGTAIAVQTFRVIAIEQHGQLTIRNHIHAATFPLSTIQTIGTSTAAAGRWWQSYGRLVVTDANGRRWPLVATTGESPEMIRLLVRDLIEAAPDAEVDVDLAMFPQAWSRRSGTERITNGSTIPGPPPASTAETQRRRIEAGHAEAERLRRELERIKASRPT